MTRQLRGKSRSREVLAQEAARWRALLDYRKARELIGNAKAYELDFNGRIYTVEVDAFWDDRPEGDIRVVLNVDDGSVLQSIMPPAEGFVVPRGEVEGDCSGESQPHGL